jgi:hypothetical protein
MGRASAFTFFSHSEHLGTFFCGFAAKKPRVHGRAVFLYPRSGYKNTTSRAFRCNSSPRLRRVCGIFAAIPCAPRASLVLEQPQLKIQINHGPHWRHRLLPWNSLFARARLCLAGVESFVGVFALILMRQYV